MMIRNSTGPLLIVHTFPLHLGYRADNPDFSSVASFGLELVAVASACGRRQTHFGSHPAVLHK